MDTTPGKWITGVYNATPAFRAIPMHACVCRESDMMLIAVCGRVTDEQSQADAELIAKAPDLLKGCEMAVDALRSYQYGNGSPDLAKEIADHLSALIARAKGS